MSDNSLNKEGFFRDPSIAGSIKSGAIGVFMNGTVAVRLKDNNRDKILGVEVREKNPDTTSEIKVKKTPIYIDLSDVKDGYFGLAEDALYGIDHRLDLEGKTGLSFADITSGSYSTYEIIDKIVQSTGETFSFGEYGINGTLNMIQGKLDMFVKNVKEVLENPVMAEDLLNTFSKYKEDLKNKAAEKSTTSKEAVDAGV